MHDALRTQLETLRSELTEILAIGRDRGDVNAALQRFDRWKTRAGRLIREQVSADESVRFEDVRGPLQLGNPFGNLERQLRAHDTALALLVEEIERDPAIVQPGQTTWVSESAAGVPGAAASPPPARDVFLIHGHDTTNLLRLKNLLRDQFHLNAVVMNEAAGRGRTLIEKFEGEAARCAYAFALLTPDDEVADGAGGYTQARPNVVFELGWFIGRLGRSRVAILLREGTRLHSDLDGIAQIRFTGSVDDKFLDIRRELEGAGLVGP